MSRKIPTKLRKLPQQDRSKMTVDAILTATAHILTEVESLTHTAVIDRPEFLRDGQLEQEIVNLLLSYVVGKRS